MIPLGIVASARVASGWTPALLPSLDLWLDAGSLALSDGNTVTAWADSSPAGNTATTSTGSPVYRTAQINGRPAVDFASASLSSAASASGADQSVAAVVRIDNLSAFRSIIGSSAAGGLQLRINQTTGYPAMLKASLAGLVTGTTGIAASTWTIITGTTSDSGNSAAVRVAKAAAGSATHGQTFTAAQTLRIGASGSATGEPWDGMFAEVIHSSALWSGADITAVESYLATKYGL